MATLNSVLSLSSWPGGAEGRREGGQLLSLCVELENKSRVLWRAYCADHLARLQLFVLRPPSFNELNRALDSLSCAPVFSPHPHQQQAARDLHDKAEMSRSSSCPLNPTSDSARQPLCISYHIYIC